MLNPQFGSGVLFGVPNGGNLPTNPTPMQFGILQEVQVEFKADLKKLFGTSQFPLAKARGKVNVSAKGKIGSLDPLFFSQLYFGLPTTTGVSRPAYNEQHAIGATVAPTNLTATQDLGVINASTGVPMINSGTTAPAAGQYKFTPGPTASYAFNATDVTAAFPVLLNYVWPDATHGTTLSITNQLLGFAPEFQALLYNNFRGSLFALQLNSCVMGSVSIPTKQEDFWIADFDLEATADVSGNIGAIYSDQL
jgi:hypothetical protein